MQLKLTTSMVVLLTVCSHGAFSETIAAASYKNVCKKFEQEGVMTRTQSLGNARDLPSNVVVVVDAENSHSRRGNNLVSNSDIIVGILLSVVPVLLLCYCNDD